LFTSSSYVRLVHDFYLVSYQEKLHTLVHLHAYMMIIFNYRFALDAFQLFIMALIALTLFFRTEMHHDNLDDAGVYAGAIFFTIMTIMFNGMAEISMTIAKLPVFYKQRDLLFFPSWAYAIPSWILKIPVTIAEVGLWVFLTYYVIGFDPNVGR